MALPSARRPRTLARRLAVLLASTMLASTVAVIVNPAPASAATCPSGRSWVFVQRLGDIWIYEAYGFTLVSSTPTFNVSDSRVAVNDLDNPISVTFTSSQSRTFTISVSASMGSKLGPWLNATVSTTITRSRTTQVGVSVTATVPPHSRIQGDYGVEAFIVTFLVRTERRYIGLAPLPFCSDLGTSTRTVNAPTIIEGWHVYQV